jgi:hypothetical protein
MHKKSVSDTSGSNSVSSAAESLRKLRELVHEQGEVVLSADEALRQGYVQAEEIFGESDTRSRRTKLGILKELDGVKRVKVHNHNKKSEWWFKIDE